MLGSMHFADSGKIDNIIVGPIICRPLRRLKAALRSP